MSSLRRSYDALLLDLDGTVYQGTEAVPGARQVLEGSVEPLFYVTNNASRSPVDVARHLAELGFPADPAHVVTSSQSAARLLTEQLPAGANVLIVGTDALAAEVQLVGLRPVRSFADDPVAVVQGHSPTTDWAILAEAALALRAGALWIATNVDLTLPSERGLLPGNGSMVAALRSATGKCPAVAGKPAKPLLEDAVRRSAARRPLVIGDRLDTDIAGANAIGADSLLVLTGVATPLDVLRANTGQRPLFVGADLSALNMTRAQVLVGPDPEWEVAVAADGQLTIRALSDDADPISGLRAAAHAAWNSDGFDAIRPLGPGAEKALAQWS